MKDVNRNEDKTQGVINLNPESISRNPLVLADLYIKRKYPNTKFNIITEVADFGVDDKNFDDLITDMKMTGIKIGTKDFETFLRSDKVGRFDPFVEYFSYNKDDWNPDDVDHIETLANHVKTDDQVLFNSMFKKHLVRAVKQAMGVNFANRFVLVLRSNNENIGKSTFLRFLNPFDSKYYFEMMDDHMELAITKSFIFNFEELDNLYKTGFNKLKAIISSSGSNIRRFHTQNYYDKPRRCTFFASTNDVTFLGGGSNTRWLIFSVESFDFEYDKTDINKVWAQASYLYHNDFDYELNQSEWELMKATSKDFRYRPKEEEYITQYFQRSTEHFATATEIESHLNRMLDQSRVDAQKIGSALSAMEYERKRFKGKWGWMIETEFGKPIKMYDNV
jgi:predicted P-loop ATPase